jgi:NTP pyrophosphatase (non-canonical NTP hydrolase)
VIWAVLLLGERLDSQDIGEKLADLFLDVIAILGYEPDIAILYFSVSL